ncbi:MAG: RNA 2',3'-cyclic phosphodiesterase [Candidatus Binataceae bacterium]
MNDLPPRLRAFVALRLNREVEDALLAFIEGLRPEAAGVRWVRRANLHVTLRFLGGAVEAAMIGAIMPRLERVADDTSRWTLAVRGAGAFPNLARPRVIWVGLRAAELGPLAERVEAAAVASGFAPEKRPYSAHLTIGRVRDLTGWVVTRRRLEDAASREFGHCPIDAMMLYRSVLGAETARYQELARFPFQ